MLQCTCQSHCCIWNTRWIISWGGCDRREKGAFILLILANTPVQQVFFFFFWNG